MAILIEEPNINGIDLNDWHKILLRTTFQGGGFINILLSELNTSNAPVIKMGSRLEVNGAFYLVNTDETISGSNINNNQWVFVYAVAGSGTLSFVYRNTMPTYSAEKNGYYSGSDRAIAKMYKLANGYWSKVILKDLESLYEDNFFALPTYSIGTALSINEDEIATLKPGAYAYFVMGGTGGNGGDGNSSGGGGAAGEIKYGNFTLDKIADVSKKATGNGANGSIGKPINNNGGRLAGGGGAAGGPSYVWIDGKFIIAAGGSGGGGGGGRNNLIATIFGGGGGGGGYGLGGTGSGTGGGRGGNNFSPGLAGNSQHGAEYQGKIGKKNMLFPESFYGAAGGNGEGYDDGFGHGGDGYSVGKNGSAIIYKYWESIKLTNSFSSNER